MSCSNCPAPKEPLPEEIFGLTFNSPHVLDFVGRKIPYDRAFLQPPHQPRSGWYVRIRLKKQWHTVAAKTPAGVVRELHRVLQLNSIMVPSKVLWACCNVQWLKRAAPKHHLVDFETFLSYISPEKPL
jgi:hypothetical protein